jgi:NAD(P)-dependent dehydrogenase (short-subunit alcohol dehydrogenase family)
MTDLSEKTCVITGAAKSIGYGVSENFAVAGARIGMIDIDPTVEAAAKALTERGYTARGFTVDVTQRDAVMGCFDEITRSYGPIYCLVNNAGVVAQTPIDRIGVAELERMFSVNVYGTVYCIQAAVRTMRELGDGRIINFSSKSGKTGSALMVAYSAAKGAIISLTQALAFELASDNIKVNCLCPGITEDTGVWNQVSSGYTENLRMEKEEVIRKFTAKVPLGRLTRIQDLVEFTTFLATSGDYCTGQAFNVSGGREMH